MIIFHDNIANYLFSRFSSRAERVLGVSSSSSAILLFLCLGSGRMGNLKRRLRSSIAVTSKIYQKYCIQHKVRRGRIIISNKSVINKDIQYLIWNCSTQEHVLKKEMVCPILPLPSFYTPCAFSGRPSRFVSFVSVIEGWVDREKEDESECSESPRFDALLLRSFLLFAVYVFFFLQIYDR